MNSNLITLDNPTIGKIDRDLINFAKVYYGASFDESKQKEICSMDVADKIWLLTQYKEELTSVSKPNLNDLY
jgi:hypothetical protein